MFVAINLKLKEGLNGEKIYLPLLRINWRDIKNNNYKNILNNFYKTNISYV